MAEPLKNKIGARVIQEDGNPKIAFYEEDIKSAVKWLKICIKNKNKVPYELREYVCEKIDKAFEDVVK